MLERKLKFEGLTFALLTISDRSYRGERDDLSGPELKVFVEKNGGRVVETAVLPDEKEAIRQKLMELCDGDESPEIVLTTGGTGLSPRDVTPEATLEVVEKEVPGLAEAMRAESLKKTPMAMLSRAVCGVRNQTLIVNLPGSRRGALENLEVVAPVLGHAVEVIRGKISDCRQSAHLHHRHQGEKKP